METAASCRRALLVRARQLLESAQTEMRGFDFTQE
jgi:hypothetical protein